MNATTTAPHSTTAVQPGRPPGIVPLLNPVLRRLLAAGVPLGPNALLTVRGRRTGQLRTTPLAIIEVGDRRWVWSPWGETDWVRNLRAAGRATITVRRRTREIRVTELNLAERATFFRDVLGPAARNMRFGVWIVRVLDGVDVEQPGAMAEGRRVFELHDAA